MKSPKLTTASLAKSLSMNYALILALTVTILVTTNDVSSMGRSLIATDPVNCSKHSHGYPNAAAKPTQMISAANSSSILSRQSVIMGKRYKENNIGLYHQVKMMNAACSAPSFTTCPSNMSISNSANSCDAIAYYNVVVTGSPAPDITYDYSGATIDGGDGDGSGSVFNIGVTTVTLTATNTCGSTTCSFTVTVSDDEAPSIYCPDEVSVSADAGTCASSHVSLSNPSAYDNCGVESIENDGPSSYNVGSTFVMWTVTDIHGNTNTCMQTVTVTDDEVPSITCSGDVYISADAGSCSSTQVSLGSNPSTDDNCGVASLENDAPQSYDVGTTYVTWTVTDIHGNKSTCTQTVTVTDDEAPSITCPANVSISVDAGSCASANANLGTPNTSDNCGIASVENDGPASYTVGTTTVTWTVTDIHGNTNTCTQTVTVTDDEKPSITCPSNVQIDADAGSCASTHVNLGTPSTGDNCGVQSVNNDGPSSYNVGKTTVTWTVTDIHGNTNTCTQAVTVTDNQKPSITCPGNVSVSTSGSAATNVSLGTPSTSDNCGVASVSNNAPSSFQQGNTTVTWTVTDIHGNTNTCNQTVTVTSSGTTPSCSISVSSCNSTYTGGVPTNLYIGYGPTSVTLTAHATGGSSFTYSWTGSNMDCGNNNKASTVFSPNSAGSYTITCKVTNSQGKKSTCSVTICVKDIRAGGSCHDQKVYICHVPSGNSGNPQSLSVSVNAVAAHLSNHSNDHLGTCSQTCGSNKDDVTDVIIEENAEGSVELMVAPNPFTSEFRMSYESTFDAQAKILVHDMTGRLVYTTSASGYTNNLNLGLDLARGVYTLTFIQGSITKSIRIVKAE